VINSPPETKSQSAVIRLLSVKVLLVSAVVLGLIGVVVFAALREKNSSLQRPPKTPIGLEPMRPSLTPAEEAYALALWPIHSEVKLSAVNMSFAGLFYKLGEIDRSTLQSRLTPLAASFDASALRFRQLQPPASMEQWHHDYAEALRLYQDAITEMIKVVDDGQDEHLLAAQAQSEKAAIILLKLSDELWPGEYKPN
jgi:hypothetical protein